MPPDKIISIFATFGVIAAVITILASIGLFIDTYQNSHYKSWSKRRLARERLIIMTAPLWMLPYTAYHALRGTLYSFPKLIYNLFADAFGAEPPTPTQPDEYDAAATIEVEKFIEQLSGSQENPK